MYLKLQITKCTKRNISKSKKKKQLKSNHQMCQEQYRGQFVIQKSTRGIEEVLVYLLITYHNTQHRWNDSSHRFRNKSNQNTRRTEHEYPINLHRLWSDRIGNDQIDETEEDSGGSPWDDQRCIIGLQAVPAIKVLSFDELYFCWNWNRNRKKKLFSTKRSTHKKINCRTLNGLSWYDLNSLAVLSICLYVLSISASGANLVNRLNVIK